MFDGRENGCSAPCVHKASLRRKIGPERGVEGVDNGVALRGEARSKNATWQKIFTARFGLQHGMGKWGSAFWDYPSARGDNENMD
jgi:hypothetical protein